MNNPTRTCSTSNAHLPCIHVEAFLGELSSDNGSPRELATSKRLDSLLCRLSVLVLDVDLANTEVGTGTGGTRNLGFDDGSVLAALLFNVFLDFCELVSTVQ
jgi:hypothetical protein